MLDFNFNNRFTEAMPGDSGHGSQRRQIRHALYSRIDPTPAKAPHLIHFSPATATLLGLSEEQCRQEGFAEIFAGNRLLPGMDPHATCYGGHQFGQWAGQLGDGRAINLGEIDLGNSHYMLQLKGAGETPYSRTADGLAVLRSSLREYVCSEAMHHLGIPTTRALSLVGTGDLVLRDILYDGNAAHEAGAVVCRVSSSFVRFGHYQLLAARDELDLLKQFTDFVIRREFPHLSPDGEITRDTYIEWFAEVSERTAHLMVHWMRVGFVHGVMNTDNMSILGETIDYGPYGWLEGFDPTWTPNTTDAGQKRYRYAQQPAIAQWNLMQLANAILPLVEDPKPLEDVLTAFASGYEIKWQQMMADKLGLKHYHSELTDQLLQLLTRHETDMTIFFRQLAQSSEDAEASLARLENAFYSADTRPAKLQEDYLAWLIRYHRVAQEQGQTDTARAEQMNLTNPLYVPRNYLAQIAIDAAEAGDYSKLDEWMRVLGKPYEEQPDAEAYAEKRPEWARNKAGCSMLSCSS